MSREETPVLAGSMPAFEMFMTAWENLSEKHPRLAPFIEIGLVWARKYYQRMDNTKAYVLAMGKTCCPSQDLTDHRVSSSQSCC
jgi:hypothetical protein